MFYDNFIEVCKNKGTTVTAVLKAIGKSTGSTGTWNAGKYPKLDTVMEMASYLNITIDELVYGKSASNRVISDTEREWLDIISNIPADKQQMCKDFLRTHMAVPEKYQDRKRG